ncbi:MAG: histidine ammonia-lyase, partial [Spirochaetota bacterium]
CQAVDLRGGPDFISVPTRAAYRVLRSAVSMVSEDRIMYPDIATATALLADGALLRAAEEAMDADIGE